MSGSADDWQQPRGVGDDYSVLARQRKQAPAYRGLLLGELDVPDARPAPHTANKLIVADLGSQDSNAPVPIRVAQVHRASGIHRAAIVQDVPLPVGVLHDHRALTDRHLGAPVFPTFRGVTRTGWTG